MFVNAEIHLMSYPMVTEGSDFWCHLEPWIIITSCHLAIQAFVLMFGVWNANQWDNHC